MANALKHETDRLWAGIRVQVADAIERAGGRLERPTRRLLERVLEDRAKYSELMALEPEQRRLALIALDEALGHLIQLIDQNIATQAATRRELARRRDLLKEAL